MQNVMEMEVMCHAMHITGQLHCVSEKAVQISFCQNFVNFPPILGRKSGKRLKLCEVYSFSTSPNSRHHTTVLNADVPNCYTTLKLLSAINFLTT